MTIIEFYTELSKLLGEYRVHTTVKNSNKITVLAEEAKASGLIVNVDVNKLMSQALDTAFDEHNSYDSYEEDSYEDEDEEDEDEEDVD